MKNTYLFVFSIQGIDDNARVQAENEFTALEHIKYVKYPQITDEKITLEYNGFKASRSRKKAVKNIIRKF